MSAKESALQGSTTRKADDPSVTDRLAGAAHDTVDRAAELGTRAEKRIRETAATSADAARENLESAKDELEAASAKAERFARENPLTAAGIAFAAGILTSLVLRR